MSVALNMVPARDVLAVRPLFPSIFRGHAGKKWIEKLMCVRRNPRNEQPGSVRIPVDHPEPVHHSHD